MTPDNIYSAPYLIVSDVLVERKGVKMCFFVGQSVIYTYKPQVITAGTIVEIHVVLDKNGKQQTVELAIMRFHTEFSIPDEDRIISDIYFPSQTTFPINRTRLDWVYTPEIRKKGPMYFDTLPDLSRWLVAAIVGEVPHTL